MTSIKNYTRYSLAFYFAGALVLLFIIAPLVSMTFASGLGEIFDTAGDKEVTNSIILTLLTSFFATFSFAILAIPFAYILARKKFPLRGLVQGIIDLPVVIPHSAAGIALLGFLSRDSFLGGIADSIGFSFVGNETGIALAMAYVSLPFLINAARDGFAAVPERLEKAALNLGAKPFVVFFRISLPLAWKSIVSGLILMFARGMSEFGAVIIIAYHPMITPVLMYERLGAFGLSYARPVAIIFIAICLVFFVVFRILANRQNNLRKTTHA